MGRRDISDKNGLINEKSYWDGRTLKSGKGDAERGDAAAGIQEDPHTSSQGDRAPELPGAKATGC
jgi:hypothetical protein